MSENHDELGRKEVEKRENVKKRDKKFGGIGKIL